MRRLVKTLALGTLATLATVGSVATNANATTVMPLSVDLQPSGRAMNQTISVNNTSANPLPVELSVQELTVDAKGAHGTGTDPGDIAVFPQQALIQPGQTQTFRIRYVGTPALAVAKHYYVTVAQLPVKLPEGQSGIQILSNFEVLTNVGPLGVKPELHVVSAAIGTNDAGNPVPVVTVANGSGTYAFLSRGNLRITEKDAAGKQIFSRTIAGPEIDQTLGMGLVDAGQQREFVLPFALASAGGTVSAEFTLSK